MFISLISNLLILALYKYWNFFGESLNLVLSKIGIENRVPIFDLLLPVGISFYTFQALSYIIDVYRGDLKAEKHFGRYALFVSFFPQLVAGPIERSKDLLPQFNEKHEFNYTRVKNGLLLMLWGLFQKVVIADRIAILVNTVYNNPQQYKGFVLIIATMCFAIQIYCDFASYSDIARGAAQVMGYSLMKNFDRPYFSKSIPEFWRRWHISLGNWFKDYLYFPLGGSRVGKLKRYRNIMIVFLTSGLWHGASWNFVIWGALHGFYQIVGMELRIVREYIVDKLHIKRESFSHRLLKTIVTFILVCFAWIFFRSNTLNDAVYIFRNIIPLNPWTLFDGTLLNLGLDGKELTILIVSIIIIIIVQLLQRNINIRKVIQNQDLWFRWGIYIVIIIVIIIFGKYGPGIDPQQFIYFQF